MASMMSSRDFGRCVRVFLRRWERAAPRRAAPRGAVPLQEMIRFNEAIGQALAGSVRQHAQQTERTRDLFAGVLAYDLRTPLSAIINSSEVLLRDNALSSRGTRSVPNLQGSAARMKRMINDLLVFTRTRLGNGLPVERSRQDIGWICRDAADEARAAYSDARIDVGLAGDLAGEWDGIRIAEMVINLLVNAVQHGAGPICVEACGDGEQITLTVSNEGSPIPRHALPTLFDPLTRG
ncbi:sensor histidine kinase [Caballeronia sp. S22]|uniref:sensor histidine kinase n=1 Tax=Caballeronia sp. S22 TaxID=3137182 RepID=UPI0035317309